MAGDSTLTLAELAARLGGDVIGDDSTRISGVATLADAGPDHISFVANPKYRGSVAASRAAAIVLGEADRDLTSRPRIVTRNPYAYFARISQLFHREPTVKPGIHPSAYVAPSAHIAASASIGAFVSIGTGARIGEGVAVGPGTQIGEGAEIGDATRLAANVTVYAGCVVGKRCIVHSGVVIGADGFGFAPDQGAWVKIPQVGRAVIGNDVEIGANTCIDRGTLGDTVIEDGVKLDNLIQIGHNVRVGAHTVMAGQVAVAGSATIGKHCLIGGQAGIVGHIAIADGVTIQAATLVTKSITKAGVYSAALPAMPHDEWLRNAAQLRRLDQLSDTIQSLNKAQEHDEEGRKK